MAAKLRIPTLPTNPYVGLRPFNESESLLFFGRREQTIELLQRLHTHHFIAVTGSSGCGKSSLIRAGLIPKLKAGLLVEDRDQWRIATMKPGDAPLANLAAALLEAQGEASQNAAELLEAVRTAGVQALLQHLAPALAAADANLLLLVDQFEEIFQFAQSAPAQTANQTAPQQPPREEAEDFVSLMLGLAAQTDLPIYVVLTMRSDFIGDCDNFYGLPEAFNRSQYLVPRLTRAQRQHVIEGPAQLFGATITPRLLDRMLNDVGEKDDQLPVLQHALLRTWEEWQRSGAPEIDLPHYEAETVGTIKNALSLDADRALAGLSKDEVEIASRMFRALTGTDARNRRVRRRAYLSELCAITGATASQLDLIIQRFEGEGRSFLMRIPGRTPDDPLIDISHESLIRQWQVLGDWLERERKSREMYRRLADAAKLYQNDETKLWRNPDLGLAMTWQRTAQPNAIWAQRCDPEANFDEVMAFLKKSIHWFLYRRVAWGVVILSVIGLLYYFQIELRLQSANQSAVAATHQLELQRKTNAVLSAREITEGVEKFTSGLSDEAFETFNQAVQLSPESPDAYYYRGNAYLQRGENVQAAADFKRYLELGGTVEKRDKAERFIKQIEAPSSMRVSVEAEERVRGLLEEMFDADKGTRIAATTELILIWSDYPPLVPLVLKKGEQHVTNKSGIINALVVLQRADPQQLHKHQAQVVRLLDQVERNGAQTKSRTDNIRAILRNSAPKNAMR